MFYKYMYCRDVGYLMVLKCRLYNNTKFIDKLIHLLLIVSRSQFVPPPNRLLIDVWPV